AGLPPLGQRAEAPVRGLVEDAARLAGPLLHLAGDLLALAHPRVGRLQAAMEHLRFLVDPARRAADLVREARRPAQADLVEEPLRLAGDALHPLRGLLHRG